jgi:putative phosphoribosyl transferase
VLVDDGLATGFTALAAVEAIRARGAERIVLAVPVSPRDSLVRLAERVDDAYCLIEQEEPPFAVASFYERFPDLTDEQVVALLDSEVA